MKNLDKFPLSKNVEDRRNEAKSNDEMKGDKETAAKPIKRGWGKARGGSGW